MAPHWWLLYTRLVRMDVPERATARIGFQPYEGPWKQALIQQAFQLWFLSALCGRLTSSHLLTFRMPWLWCLIRSDSIRIKNGWKYSRFQSYLEDFPTLSPFSQIKPLFRFSELSYLDCFPSTEPESIKSALNYPVQDDACFKSIESQTDGV